jgi:hypothetical protein
MVVSSVEIGINVPESTFFHDIIISENERKVKKILQEIQTKLTDRKA